MAERSRDEEQNGFLSILDELPVDRLKSELQGALSAAAERTAEAATDKISSLTDRLTDVASNGGVASKALAEGGKAAATGGSPLLGALKGGVMGAKDKAAEMLGGGSGGSGGKNPLKATTIIESIDVGVPIDVAYNQWTQFQDFSGFMKKVEKVEQKTDEKLDFKAKILWSHRTWEASILEQVPDEKIVWRSKGEKGHVDGTVTFHELASNLTRVLVVLEYYPQGLFERVGNIWRAQGRRARVELKHFQRHVMTDVILHPDEVEGWRGEIHKGRVSEGSEDDDESGDEYDEDEYDDEGEEDQQPEDEYEDEEDEEPADEYDEDEEPADEYEDEGDEDEPTDEYEDEEADEGDEYDEDEEEPADEDEDDEYDEDEEDEEPADEYEDEGDEDLPEDEYEDDEGEEDEDAEYGEDEYDDEEDLPEDEYEDDEEEEPETRPRRRAS
jgi:uncharacterized membrane protein